MRTMTVTGHLAADAQKLISKTGNEYMSFRIGSSERNDKKDGVERTYWFRVTCTNKAYINLLPYLTKGSSVIVTGDYRDDIYQNREGNCDISRDIFASAIYFNGGGSNGDKTLKAVTEPTTQTQMVEQPSTAEIEIPKKKKATAKKAKAEEVNTDTDDDVDELPF